MILKYIKTFLYFLAYLFHRNYDSKVVYYHDVSKKYTSMGTDIELMKMHFSLIRESGYEIVPCMSKRKKQVMICFDDGWAGIYDNKDYFVELGIKPTIFIAVDLIGKDGYLTVEQIKELEKSGFIFECHTWSHQDLTQFEEAELQHELLDSKRQLESVFLHPFNAICYPMGRFSELVYETAKNSGYTKQYSSVAGGYYDLEHRGVICRLCAQFSSPSEFKWMLNSTSRFFRKKYLRQQFVN